MRTISVLGHLPNRAAIRQLRRLPLLPAIYCLAVGIIVAAFSAMLGRVVSHSGIGWLVTSVTFILGTILAGLAAERFMKLVDDAKKQLRMQTRQHSAMR